MPRGFAGGTRRRNAASSMRLEKMYRETQEVRAAARARKRAAAQRSNIIGWDALCRRVERLDIQAEIDVMELRLVNGERAERGLAPITFLPPDGGLGDTRHPADDYRNYPR